MLNFVFRFVLENSTSSTTRALKPHNNELLGDRRLVSVILHIIMPFISYKTIFFCLYMSFCCRKEKLKRSRRKDDSHDLIPGERQKPNIRSLNQLSISIGPNDQAYGHIGTDSSLVIEKEPIPKSKMQTKNVSSTEENDWDYNNVTLKDARRRNNFEIPLTEVKSVDDSKGEDTMHDNKFDNSENEKSRQRIAIVIDGCHDV